jgi:hypothetical protein
LLPLAAPELHFTAACSACITALLLHLLPLAALHFTAACSDCITACSACITASLCCRLQRLKVRALLLHFLPYLVLYLVVRHTFREPTAA